MHFHYLVSNTHNPLFEYASRIMNTKMLPQMNESLREHMYLSEKFHHNLRNSHTVLYLSDNY